ncbi:MAG: hypothetical protein Fur0037_03260 [Planctomycetota bacterium]
MGRREGGGKTGGSPGDDSGPGYDPEAVRRDVEAFGCHLAALADQHGRVIGAFTVGLWSGHGHPEIAVFGLELNQAEDLLDAIQERVEQGESFAPGSRCEDLLRNYPCEFRAIDPAHLRLFAPAVSFHGGTDFSMLQLFWPDRQGRFPWSPGAREEHRRRQPRLDLSDLRL